VPLNKCGQRKHVTSHNPNEGSSSRMTEVIMGSQVIPIKKVTGTGDWLRLELQPEHSSGEELINMKATNEGLPLVLQLRFIEFTKIELDMVDAPEKLSLPPSSNVWRLGLEVVNLCRRELPASLVGYRVVIADQNGFEYRIVRDNHLTCYSEYANSSGLHAFHRAILPPKIKRTGSFAYEIPAEFEQLFLIARRGELSNA
jgi:hypothetical protein